VGVRNGEASPSHLPTAICGRSSTAVAFLRLRATATANGFLGSPALASVPGETCTRKFRKNETRAVVQHEGVEAIVQRTYRRLGETARDAGPGAVVGLDEDEPPVAPLGGVLL
jgi:hypothetical protein